MLNATACVDSEPSLVSCATIRHGLEVIDQGDLKMKTVSVYQSPLRDNAWIVETIEKGISSELIIFLGRQAQRQAHSFGHQCAHGHTRYRADQFFAERRREEKNENRKKKGDVTFVNFARRPPGALPGCVAENQ
jgi:hypothetical protein